MQVRTAFRQLFSRDGPPLPSMGEWLLWCLLPMLLRWKSVLLRGHELLVRSLSAWQIWGAYVQDVLLWCVVFAVVLPRLRSARAAQRLWAVLAIVTCNLILVFELLDVQCKKAFLQPLTVSLAIVTLREAKFLYGSVGAFATAAFLAAAAKSLVAFNGSLLLRRFWPWFSARIPTAAISRMAPRVSLYAIPPLALIPLLLPPLAYQLDGNVFTTPFVSALRSRTRSADNANLAEECDEPARTPSSTPRREPTAAIARGRNVVVFVVETLSYAESSLADKESDRTPLLRELAEYGPIATPAHAQVPYSTKAIYGILTGRYASPTLEVVESEVARLDSLARTLKSAGYFTAFLSTQFLDWQAVGRQYVAMGFDTIVGGEQLKTAAAAHDRKLATNQWGVDDKELVAGGMLEALPTDRPFFAVVYNTASHQPYTYSATERPGTDLERYRGALRYGDDALREVVAYLKRRGKFDDTVFVMVGDHGDDFKNGRWKVRGCSLNDASVLVPLVIAVPGAGARPTSVAGARQIDIVPTLLDLLGIAPDSPLQGRSLLDAPSTTPSAYLNGYGACDVAGVVDGRTKAIYDGYTGEVSSFTIEEGREGPPMAVVEPSIKATLVRRLRACSQYNEKALRSLLHD